MAVTVAGCSQHATEPTPTPNALDLVQSTAKEEPKRVMGLAADGPVPTPTPDTRDEVARAEDYYGIPRGILNAIAVWESSSGANACGYNEWGYASCAVTFSSRSEGIWTVAATLANYGGDTAWKLCVWNAGPDGCLRGLADGYVARVLAEMP